MKVQPLYRFKRVTRGSTRIGWIQIGRPIEGPKSEGVSSLGLESLSLSLLIIREYPQSTLESSSILNEEISMVVYVNEIVCANGRVALHPC
jgi:hypothetical protein